MVAANVLNKQSWTTSKCMVLQLGRLSGGLTTFHHKKPACYKMLHRNGYET